MDQWTLSDLIEDLMDYIMELDLTTHALMQRSRLYKHTFVSFEIDGKFFTNEQCKSTPIKGLIHNLTIFKLHANYGLADAGQVQEEAGFCSIF
ncbi:UNKNOWN [Stylonychia lemnae]|uniref:Uncharacterized protein n=1 Tax=Stylonychia lemnae TaxID=5949 RepID=A0A077ZWU8_STYLE|nr:UNKNOWN [Stylonychia lemnae]|eukprot:CDW72966.1 UNKNOWN [Stylonychia lemnae]